MREADGLDLLLGPSRRAAKCSCGDFGSLVGGVVLRDGLGRVDREEFRRAPVAHRGRDRVRGDLAVDRAGREVGIRPLVADGIGGLVGRKLDDLDLFRIDAVLPQHHLEQIDIGVGAADDADATPGKLRNLGDGGGCLLAFDLAGCRHPQHRHVLAQRRHGLRVLRHFEIAADDGEIDLAVTDQLGACNRAIGRHRAQPDQTALLVVEGLCQVLNDLEVVAVGGTHGDLQRHRPHRKIIARGQRADEGEHAGQQHEGQPSFRRSRRRQGRLFRRIVAVGHQYLSLKVQFHAAGTLGATI